MRSGSAACDGVLREVVAIARPIGPDEAFDGVQGVGGEGPAGTGACS